MINYSILSHKSSEIKLNQRVYKQANQQYQMKLEESLIGAQQRHNTIPTVQYGAIMTEQFISAYKSALQFSNLSLDHQLKFRNVTVHTNEHMHEIYTVGSSHLPHLVLLHGYGGTSLTYIRTFQLLHDHYQIHALDTFGVGLSSRGKWRSDMTLEETRLYFIDAIEQWRKSVGIQSFVLVGHSFGGYIATLYYEQYSQYVDYLVLLSPAGSGKLTEQAIQERANKSKIFFCLAEKIYNLNFRPSRIMNACFIGNKFMERILNNRLKLPEDEKAAWKTYLKHVIKIEDSSQGGFYTFFQWPLQPQRSIEDILRGMKDDKKVHFFFGDTDWMNRDGAKRLVEDCKHISFEVIKDSGHQLIFDNPKQVANMLIKLKKQNNLRHE